MGIIVLGATLGPIAIGAPWPAALLSGGLAVLVSERWQRRRDRAHRALLDTLSRRVRDLAPEPIVAPEDPAWAELVASWNRDWAARQPAIEDGLALAEIARALPRRFEEGFGSITLAADRQEEAIEETASLVANMRQSMKSIGEQVEQLTEASSASSSAILELGSSVDEVADSTRSLHASVDASTSSIHEMGASIRQVATGADEVRALAETTAASAIQMDRSVQEVSSHAVEAATLTQNAHEGASAGREAVDATISDIEQISSLTGQAMERVGGLVSRISQVGHILSAIDEINDETNLLSLNAAIIAAQAGEQGKAFLVVANHVKTLARRTAASTHDIEKLILAIEAESAGAVRAMEEGIDAVETGVSRSRDAGRALESIQEACSDASERVAEIARATSEQSRNSKGVAEAAQNTSRQIQQISDAIREQRRASESLLVSSENGLANCLQVATSTEEQRTTTRQITSSIEAIDGRIQEIGRQTEAHAQASEAVSEAVLRLLDNAQASGAGAAPLRALLTELDRHATRIAWPDALPPPPSSGETPDERA